MVELLKLLEDDAALSAAQLAAILGLPESEVREKIKKFEDDGTLLGYKTIINWERTEREFVTALIEVKVIPDMTHGFESVARQIWNYDEVTSVYLMSGGFDLAVIIEGHTLREVALFVAEKLACIGAVSATATHFILKKYKDKGIVFAEQESDSRGLL